MSLYEYIQHTVLRPAGQITFAHRPEANTNPADYDPAAALQAAMEYETKPREVTELQAKFDQWREAEIEEARYKAPPAAVQAYRDVYGKWPGGWVV